MLTSYGYYSQYQCSVLDLQVPSYKITVSLFVIQVLLGKNYL